MNNTRQSYGQVRPYVLIFVGSLLVMLAQGFWHQLEEARWWNDLIGKTPFSAVHIKRTVAEENTLTVWGSLEKVRCEKLGHAAYVEGPKGYNVLAGFDSSGEDADTPVNRPQSDTAQSFGPWVIISRIAHPVAASFFVRHRCPEGVVWNEVFRVRWENYLEGEK
jgi:hypothetical protein